MPDRSVTMLVETPLRIAALTADLRPAQLHSKPNPNEWSANDVLAHLRSCANMWGNCIKVILDQDKPAIRAINPRNWIKSTNYLELEFHHSLRSFAKQRTALLKVLEALTPKDWSRTATVTGAGKPLVWTVHSYAQWMASHERPAIKQIVRIANTMPTLQRRPFERLPQIKDDLMKGSPV